MVQIIDTEKLIREAVGNHPRYDVDIDISDIELRYAFNNFVVNDEMETRKQPRQMIEVDNKPFVTDSRFDCFDEGVTCYHKDIGTLMVYPVYSHKTSILQLIHSNEKLSSLNAVVVIRHKNHF